MVTALLSEELEALGTDKPWLSFGHRALGGGNQDAGHRVPGGQLGDACIYWHFTTRGLREMMEYAGFARTEAMTPVDLPPTAPELRWSMASAKSNSETHLLSVPPRLRGGEPSGMD